MRMNEEHIFTRYMFVGGTGICIDYCNRWVIYQVDILDQLQQEIVSVAAHFLIT